MSDINQTYVTQGRDLAIVTRAKGEVLTDLPTGVYRLCHNSIRGWWFTKIKDFSLPDKLYGNIRKRSKRILDTFNMRRENGDPTGVLLSGIKGSGKTLLAKKVAVDSDLPVIVINQAHTSDDFKDIIANIGPCVLIFDEFEKVYEERSAQNTVLTLLNGVFSNEVLSFIIVNDLNKLVGPLLNRPGRLYYALEYGGLAKEFIVEYAEDRLNSYGTEGHWYDPENDTSTDWMPDPEATATRIRGILSVASMFKHFTFDHLQAMVEEMNRYGESAKEVIEYLNVKLPKPGYFERFSVRIWKNGTEITKFQNPDFRTKRDSPVNTNDYLYFKVSMDGDDDTEYIHINDINMTALDLDTNSITFENQEGVKVVYQKQDDPSYPSVY